MNIKFFKELINETKSRSDIDIGTVQAIFKEIDDIFIVSFRATDSNADWWNHLLLKQAIIPYDNQDTKVRIHSGWLNEYKQIGVRNVVLARVKEFIQRKPNGSIYVTGHSYGAALAVICSVDIEYNNSCAVYCFPFSGPRVGNDAFIESFIKRVKYIGFYYGADVVAQVPPYFTGYRKLPGLIHFGKRRIIKIFLNSLSAILWWIQKKPIKVEDVNVLWDHSPSNFPDDYEILLGGN